MLISALCEYYDILASQGKLSPDGYSKVGIHYLVSLDENGHLSSVLDWQVMENREVKGKQKEFFTPRPILLPSRTEKTGIDANIIEHRPLYIFGLNYDSKTKTLSFEDKTDKAKKSHAAFVAQNLRFVEGIDVPVVNAYRAFLHNWQPEQETENPILLSLGKKLETGHFAFCLAGRSDLLLHETLELKQKWASEYAQNNTEEEQLTAQCSITGKKEPIARIHDKIKGVPGGLATGSTLISFKNPSDESYGKEQSFNSSVSQSAMKKYSEALNYLLSDRKHRTAIDDTVYVYWAASTNEEYDDLMSAMTFDATMDCDATNEWLLRVFENIRAGKATQAVAAGMKRIDPNVWFYVVGLKPNSARLAVKCIYRQSIGSLLENVVQHYQDIQLSGIDRPISLCQIGKELVSPKSKNDTASPALMAKLLEAVLLGTPYPKALLGTLVRRVMTDSDEEESYYIQMNDTRLGLIKACINRDNRANGKEEEIKMSLDTENRSPAYLCGRLFCKLEEIQAQALGDLNRTIKDAYFASAATCPALTFPRLLRLSQHHLAKLDEKTHFFFDREVTQIMGLLEGGFPNTLSLKEQGTFMLGYYQQRNEKFTKKAAADAAKEEE